jgi:hypothetical protein
MRISWRAASLFTIMIACAIVLSAQAGETLIGTWKLNLAKSKYSPAELAPKSGTTKVEATQDGLRMITDGVDEQGRITHSEYTFKFDGKDHPWKGTIEGKPNPNRDAVAWKKIDNNTYEFINKLKGRVLTTTRVVISSDGKTRTNTSTGKNAQGQTLNNTEVYEKQ